MFDLREQLAIYKFDLLNLCWSNNAKNINYWKELREKLILLNKLIKRVKTDNTIECTQEIKEIKEFIAKSR